MSTPSELEQRILSEMEETGERDLVHLINSTSEIVGSIEEVAALQSALGRLVTAELVRVAMQRFLPRALEIVSDNEARQIIDRLGSMLEFGKHGKYWHYREIDIRKDLYPTIILTDSGLRTSRDALTRRGYQWWRPKRK